MAGMTVSAVELRTARLSSPRLFGSTLIVATVIPFLAGGIGLATDHSPVVPLQAVVALLAAIHVPMTVYLLVDPAIRKMMRDRPVALIVAPLLIFGAVFAVNYFTIESRKAGTSTEYVYFMSFVVAWNLWHFGKQNIGVYSFFRAGLAESVGNASVGTKAIARRGCPERAVCLCHHAWAVFQAVCCQRRYELLSHGREVRGQCRHRRPSSDACRRAGRSLDLSRA
jgi:hypothetical protein